jgi:hypothetical protein
MSKDVFIGCVRMKNPREKLPANRKNGDLFSLFINAAPQILAYFFYTDVNEKKTKDYKNFNGLKFLLLNMLFQTIPPLARFRWARDNPFI